jgi:hypothetical protein
MNTITPRQAKQQFPHSFRNEQVYEVVSNAVDAGEAELYVATDGILMYDDPVFHEKVVAVRDLGYNSEIGLHLKFKED